MNLIGRDRVEHTRYWFDPAKVSNSSNERDREMGSNLRAINSCHSTKVSNEQLQRMLRAREFTCCRIKPLSAILWRPQCLVIAYICFTRSKRAVCPRLFL